MTMKKSNKNKTEKKGHHNVETPAPPQVMDPSAPPLKKEKDIQQSKEADARAVEKKKAPDNEKLTPSEEL
jgi:hypothetical protein